MLLRFSRVTCTPRATRFALCTTARSGGARMAVYTLPDRLLKIPGAGGRRETGASVRGAGLFLFPGGKLRRAQFPGVRRPLCCFQIRRNLRNYAKTKGSYP